MFLHRCFPIDVLTSMFFTSIFLHQFFITHVLLLKIDLMFVEVSAIDAVFDRPCTTKGRFKEWAWFAHAQFGTSGYDGDGDGESACSFGGFCGRN